MQRDPTYLFVVAGLFVAYVWVSTPGRVLVGILVASAVAATVLYYASTEVCGSCNRRATKRLRHTRVDGGPDRRYSTNPAVCSVCGATWTTAQDSAVAASIEWTEWHITSGGWLRGSTRTDNGQTTILDHPQSLAVFRYSEEISYAGSRPSGKTERVARGAGDESRVVEAISTHGPCPTSL